MTYQRIVIKLGTSVLTAGQDRLCRPRMVELIRQMALLRDEGKTLTLVSSGAVLAGWEQLGFPKRKRTLTEKQLLAAIGQGRLMHLYAQLAEIYGITVAQTLLTRADFSDRRRYLNARNTFWSCHEKGVLPIVNENDVVAIDEIKLGDNDTLAAYVASLVEADLLIICSDIDGLYTANPRVDSSATLISEIAEITQATWALAGGTGSARGTGGMQTKIQAADLATRAGIAVRIVSGDLPDVLLRTARGEAIGSLFLPRVAKLEARKRWIMAETVRHSRVVVDEGASRALQKGGKSLLPAGVTEVEGQFEQGQTIRIYNAQNQEIARGLTHYNTAELRQIKGARSADILTLLGYTSGDEVVHRDNLVVL